MSEDLSVEKRKAVKGLGRGIGSLLGEVAANKSSIESITNTAQAKPLPQQQPSVEVQVKNTDRIWKVAIEKIVPNKEQPRKHFNPEKLTELANSIKGKGILLPIIVRQIAEGKFEIIAGERRWRAAQQAGQHEVPVIIKNAESGEVLELALIENVQRQDINPIEEADAYQILAQKYKLTQQQIADKVNKDRSTIANLMRLSLLAPETKALVKSGELTIGHAKVLLALNDAKLQHQLAQKAIKQQLSVRATERLVAKLNAAESEAAHELEDQLEPRDIQPLISELQRILGTKVNIETNGQRSKVTVQFYSLPELNQFVDRMRKIKP